MQPSVGTLDRAPRGVREREPRRAPDTLKVRPWYIPPPLLQAPVGVLSASEDVVACDCRNRTSPHLVDIERARSTVARSTVYRIGAIACRVGSETTGDGYSRLFGRLRVDFGAVDVVGRAYCARSSRSRCAIIRTFLLPREYLFNNRESDRSLPHLRIDQVRGVRLGNPTGSDPR